MLIKYVFLIKESLTVSISLEPIHKDEDESAERDSLEVNTVVELPLPIRDDKAGTRKLIKN